MNHRQIAAATRKQAAVLLSSSESSSDNDSTPKRSRRKDSKKVKKMLNKYRTITKELEKENKRVKIEKRKSVRKMEDEIAKH